MKCKQIVAAQLFPVWKETLCANTMPCSLHAEENETDRLAEEEAKRGTG